MIEFLLRVIFLTIKIKLHHARPLSNHRIVERNPNSMIRSNTENKIFRRVVIRRINYLREICLTVSDLSR